MTLADEILAARGTQNDMGGIITSLASALEQAERFVLHDDVAAAGYQLIRSRPSSLLDGLALCRLPFSKLWLEWRGGVSLNSWPVYPTTERDPATRTVARPVPKRTGCLIEARDDGGQTGQITWAWVHDSGVNVCPLAVNFDWREGADVTSEALASLGSLPIAPWRSGGSVR